jgi:hypothetical protein
VEVSLVIGIIDCPSSSCPAASANLGDILFIGKFQSQGVIDNFIRLHLCCSRWLVRLGFLPLASSAQLFSHSTSKFCFYKIRITKVILTLLQKGQAIPTVEYQFVAVELSLRDSNHTRFQ